MILSWLRLVRWGNLLLLALTQIVAYCCAVTPCLFSETGLARLRYNGLLLLVASTVFIAAGGYIINDYYDQEMDAVNKPDKRTVGLKIKPGAALAGYWLCNAAGILCAGWLALRSGAPQWLTAQLACMLLLWQYSRRWKKEFMTGNVAVAFLAAFSILILMLYEPGFYRPVLTGPAGREYATECLAGGRVLIGFAVFSFLLTWMREIVKDLEDADGDAQHGCSTLALQWGARKAVWLVQWLGALVLLLLAGIIFHAHPSGLYAPFFFVCSIGFVAIPILAFIAWLPRSTGSTHYHRGSIFLKLLMLAGIGWLLAYTFSKHA